MRVELRDIRKYFGTVKANDGISLTLQPGKIYALVGENGAGKSTLMKILSGSPGTVCDHPADRRSAICDRTTDGRCAVCDGTTGGSGGV